MSAISSNNNHFQSVINSISRPKVSALDSASLNINSKQKTVNTNNAFNAELNKSQNDAKISNQSNHFTHLNNRSSNTSLFNLSTGAKTIDSFTAIKKVTASVQNHGKYFSVTSHEKTEENKIFSTNENNIKQQQAIFKEMSSQNSERVIELTPTEIRSNQYQAYLSNRKIQQINGMKQGEIQHIEKGNIQFSAGKQHVGFPNYKFKMGADGNSYVVSVSLNTDLSMIRDRPELTITKMQSIHNAALVAADHTFEEANIALQTMKVIKATRLEAFYQNMKDTLIGND